MCDLRQTCNYYMHVSEIEYTTAYKNQPNHTLLRSLTSFQYQQNGNLVINYKLDAATKLR